MKEIISMIDIDMLKDLSVVKSFPAKQIIIKEGATEPYSMYIVLSGQVEVWKNFNSAQRMSLETFEAGGIFGEMSLFWGEPRSATVIAVTDVTLLELSENSVEDIMKANPKLPYGLLMLLCQRIQKLNNKLQSLTT